MMCVLNRICGNAWHDRDFSTCKSKEKPGRQRGTCYEEDVKEVDREFTKIKGTKNDNDAS